VVAGESAPKLAPIAAMARAGGVSIDWLATGQAPDEVSVTLVDSRDNPENTALSSDEVAQVVKLLEAGIIERRARGSTKKLPPSSKAFLVKNAVDTYILTRNLGKPELFPELLSKLLNVGMGDQNPDE